MRKEIKTLELILTFFFRKQSLLDKVKSPANRFKNATKGLSSTVSYNDYQESSSEIEDFVKPFHDEPDKEKFLKPYRDEE